jgi:ParB family chromosome partitioning protein
LNALDKAETLVAIACDEIQELIAEEVPRIVNRVLIRLKRKQKDLQSQLGLGERLHLQPPKQQQAVLARLELETIETQVFAVFLSLQEHPTSLNRNVFPALNLLPDLKAAVREKGLSCPQALILNRLTAAELNISDKEALALRQQGIRGSQERLVNR